MSSPEGIPMEEQNNCIAQVVSNLVFPKESPWEKTDDIALLVHYMPIAKMINITIFAGFIALGVGGAAFAYSLAAVGV